MVPDTHVEETDVLIAGCGVAGGMLARRLAEAGLRVIVVEKRPSVGVPVRCAEATGSAEELSHFIPIDSKWIAAEVNGIRLTAPGGESLARRSPGLGLVHERDLFDQALAARAEEAGAEIRTNNEVTGLCRDKGRFAGATILDHARNATYMIKARLTVGADGVESYVGRWAGLKHPLTISQIHSCAQYLMEGPGFPDDEIWIHAGRSIAPGGYAWVFPKGKGRANVGVGVIPSMAGGRTAKDYLDDFMAANFPSAAIVRVIAGATSGIKTPASVVADGLLLAGEAAGHNNPFSGGGIMNSLESAEEAAPVIIDSFARQDLSARSLGAFDRRWYERNGRTIDRFAFLRRVFARLSDREMDTVIGVLGTASSGMDPRSIDYAGLFRNAFSSLPGVFIKAGASLWEREE